MDARQVTPILNVSDLPVSFAWFAELGWTKHFDWCDDDGVLSFGSVMSGDCEIFLCREGQGGRGADGTWLSIWVDDVDAVHARCLRQGVEVVMPPRDMSWGVRELHIRHPDGHTFRVSRSSTTH